MSMRKVFKSFKSVKRSLNTVNHCVKQAKTRNYEVRNSKNSGLLSLNIFLFMIKIQGRDSRVEFITTKCS